MANRADRCQAVSDIDDAGIARISSEPGRTPPHVAHHNRRRRLKPNLPPRLPVLRDVRLGCSRHRRHLQERIDILSLSRGQLTQIYRQVDHSTQVRRVTQKTIRIDYLHRIGDAGEQIAPRNQSFGFPGGNPDLITSRHLPAADPEIVAEQRPNFEMRRHRVPISGPFWKGE